MKKTYIFVVMLLVFCESSMAVGPSFSVILGVVGFSRLVLALMFVAAAISGVFLIHFVSGLILEKIQGGGVEKIQYGGKSWDGDVYHSAMEDMHRRQRNGELLDHESAKGLREYKRGW